MNKKGQCERRKYLCYNNFQINRYNFQIAHCVSEDPLAMNHSVPHVLW